MLTPADLAARYQRTGTDRPLWQEVCADVGALLARVAQLEAELAASNEELRRTAEVLYGEPMDAHALHETAAEIVAERDRLVSLCHAAASDIEACGGDAHDSSSLLRRLRGEQGGGYVSDTLRAAITQIRAERDEAVAALANERAERASKA